MHSHEHRHDHHGHDHPQASGEHHEHGNCCGGTSCATSARAAASAHDVVRDPVCGMTVDPHAGKPTAEHGGRTFHFCSAGCREKFASHPENYLTATDPVCGMKVDRAGARHFLRRDGEKHYFCSAGCQTKFEADPERYLSGKAPPAPMPKGTQWTCPMHPEIVRDKPGSCPIC
jgi:Cu+-exporting ATPase